jgi:hypothetical protein
VPGVNRELVGVEVERPEHERLSADDQATARALDIQSDALAAHRRRNAVHGTPGTCSFCSEACLPQAVYCDVDCRRDHERLLGARARAGA